MLLWGPLLVEGGGLAVSEALVEAVVAGQCGVEWHIGFLLSHHSIIKIN